MYFPASEKRPTTLQTRARTNGPIHTRKPTHYFIFLRLALPVAILLAFGLDVPGQEPGLKQQLLSDGPKGWARLKEQTTHAEGRAELSEAPATERNPSQWRTTTRWNFKLNGD